MDVFTDWAEKFSPVKQQEDNLDHASEKLKFNRNVMSMVGRSPSKPGNNELTMPCFINRDGFTVGCGSTQTPTLGQRGVGGVKI